MTRTKKNEWTNEKVFWKFLDFALRTVFVVGLFFFMDNSGFNAYVETYKFLALIGMGFWACFPIMRVMFSLEFLRSSK